MERFIGDGDNACGSIGGEMRQVSSVFMALLVIPALKLSDEGLFDGAKFEFTDLLA